MLKFFVALICTLGFLQTANAAFRVELIGIAGFPSGGSTGQVLKKNSGTDYDSAWADEFIKAVSTIGAAPNANGLLVTSGTLVLEPASASFGGVVTTGTQTMAGAKTFSTSVSSPAITGSTTITTPQLNLTIQASDPATPAEGWVYYNSVSHVIKFYNGSVWKTITTN